MGNPSVIKAAGVIEKFSQGLIFKNIQSFPYWASATANEPISIGRNTSWWNVFVDDSCEIDPFKTQFAVVFGPGIQNKISDFASRDLRYYVWPVR